MWQTVGYIVNDWSLSGIWTASTGTPYSVSYSYQNGGGTALTGSPDYTARVLVNPSAGFGAGGCNGDDPTRQFNTSGPFAGPQANSDGLESGNGYLKGCARASLTSRSREGHQARRKQAASAARGHVQRAEPGSNHWRNTTMNLDSPATPTTITQPAVQPGRYAGVGGDRTPAPGEQRFRRRDGLPGRAHGSGCKSVSSSSSSFETDTHAPVASGRPERFLYGGPSDRRTLGPLDPWTLGPLDPRTLGPSDPRIPRCRFRLESPRCSAARRPSLIDRGIHCVQRRLAQVDAGRADVFLQVIDLGRAWNRNDVVAPREQPGQRELRHRAAGLARNRRVGAQQPKIGREVFVVEARELPADVGRMQRGWIAEPAGQEPARERAEGHEGRADRPACVEDRDFCVARPERGTRSGRRRSDARRGPGVAWPPSTSERPSVRILPSRTRSARAPMLSSIGTSFCHRCR